MQTDIDPAVQLTSTLSRNSIQRLHLANCPYIAQEDVMWTMSVEEVERNFREYPDDGALRPHNCCRRLLSADYRHGRKPDGTIAFAG